MTDVGTIEKKILAEKKNIQELEEDLFEEQMAPKRMKMDVSEGSRNRAYVGHGSKTFSWNNLKINEMKKDLLAKKEKILKLQSTKSKFIY